MRSASAKTAAALLLASLLAPAVARGQAYPAVNFAATHNSYSGNIAGQRGTIVQQLDAGARFVEYDLNLGNFASIGDYQIGHGSPGRQVDHTAPNPPGNDLGAWLAMLASWSDSHPGHAPIALGLDSKNDLSAQASPLDGNLSALNAELENYLGQRLYTAAALGAAPWPQVQALQGKILVVLSGNQDSRKHYRSDQGKTPAVAINANGQAIAVYQSSESANLWYWYGLAGSGGDIAWPVHGKYDTGVTPAVAIDGSGVIVEVHKSQNNSQLWSRVGLVQNGQVAWGKSQQLGASGTLPSVAYTGPGLVGEIHVDGKGQNQLLEGTVDAAAKTIKWQSQGATSQPRYPTTTATAGELSVTVSLGTSPGGVAGTLFYATPGRPAPQLLIYPQLMFTEYQKGDSSQLSNDNLRFYACSSGSGNWTWASDQRKAGKVVRLWGFSSSSTGIATPPNFPATDTPYADWYTRYCAAISCQQ